MERRTGLGVGLDGLGGAWSGQYVEDDWPIIDVSVGGVERGVDSRPVIYGRERR